MKSTAIKNVAGRRRKRCAQCGAEFEPPSDCVSRAARYCTRECGWAAQREAADAARPSAGELQTLHHDQGLSIPQMAAHYNRSDWWVTTAMATRGVARRPRVTGAQISCEFCGTKFYAKPSQMRRGRRFCSKACKGRGMPSPTTSPEARAKISAAKTGARNANFRDGLSERSVARVFNLRLKGETCCRNCGDGGWLHLHHIVPRSMCKAAIRDLRNGVPLCAGCHLGWHRRRFVIYRDILTDEEWKYVSSLRLLGQEIGAWLDDRYPPRTAIEARARA